MMTLTAVLFVGGLSTRMGRDKALVEIDGEALWARQLRLLQELKPQRICLSCRSNPSWCPPEVKVIPDKVPSRGPLSGLTAALERIETTHLLAIAIDLPRMNAGMLRELWRISRPGCGVVPVIEDQFEPLCAIYPSEAVSQAWTALNAGELSLQKYVRALFYENLVATWPVPLRYRGAFFNANSPEDLQQL